MPGTLLTRPTARADARSWPNVSANGALPKSIASRCLVNAQNGGIVGTVTGETLLQDHKCLANCDGIRLAYSNSYGGGRTIASNAIYVRASVEDPAGNIHQASFNGAAEILLLPGLPTGISDSLGIGFSNGDRFRTRTFVRVANVGELTPNGATTRSSPYIDGVLSGDQTTAASPAWTTDANYHFGPAAVLADFTDAQCIVGIDGDSISAGQNDGNSNIDQQGWVLRALNDQWPYLQSSIPGDSAIAFKPPTASYGTTSRKPRISLANGITHKLVPLGTNDVGSATTAQIQDALLRVWGAAAMRGQRVIAVTIPPGGVTSSDSFATLVNQTINANDARRTAVNDWIRAGAPISATTRAAVAIGTAGAVTFGSAVHPGIGYWEIADIVESSRNSGKWRVDLGVLSDGTHPNAAGSALIAASANVDLTMLGPKAPGAAAPAAIIDPSTIFGANLFAQYKSTAITGKNDGDAISSWADSSGNSRPLIMATGSKQPLYKTNINYSKPVVRFDGTDDFMQTAAFGTLAQPFTVIIVAKFRTSGAHAASPYFLGGQGGSTFNLRWGAGASPQPVTFGAGSNIASAFIADPAAAWHTWEGLANGASSAVYKDGSSIVTGNAGSGSITALAVAADGNGGSLSDIDVQEVIVVNRAVTTQERSDLHAYMTQTWGTP